MKRKFIFLSILSLLSIILIISIVSANAPTRVSNNTNIVGNDKDSHGCIGSAGYQWCEEKQKCLRSWEENCSSINNNSTNSICGNGICETGEGPACPKCDTPGQCGACATGTCPQDCNNTNNNFPGEGKTKILPETASQIAKQKLGDLGFNITLKDVGQNNTIYEAKAIKQGKFLGIFKVNAEVSADIDPQTGEVIKINRPWWSFLAGI